MYFGLKDFITPSGLLYLIKVASQGEILASQGEILASQGEIVKIGWNLFYVYGN